MRRRWLALGAGFVGGGSFFALLLLVTALTVGRLPAVEIRAHDFGFEPSTIQVAEEGSYRVALVNTGRAAHNLTFSDGTQIAAPGGVTTSRTLSLSPAGVDFYCSHLGHEQVGMTGRIIVGH